MFIDINKPAVQCEHYWWNQSDNVPLQTLAPQPTILILSVHCSPSIVWQSVTLNKSKSAIWYVYCNYMVSGRNQRHKINSLLILVKVLTRRVRTYKQTHRASLIRRKKWFLPRSWLTLLADNASRNNLILSRLPLPGES